MCFGKAARRWTVSLKFGGCITLSEKTNGAYGGSRVAGGFLHVEQCEYEKPLPADSPRIRFNCVCRFGADIIKENCRSGQRRLGELLASIHRRSK